MARCSRTLPLVVFALALGQVLLACPGGEPVIGVSAIGFSFGTEQTEWVLEVFNDAENGSVLSFEVTTTADWVTLDPASGESSGPTDVAPITVRIDRTNLSKATFGADIVIDAGDLARTVRITVDEDLTAPGVEGEGETSFEGEPVFEGETGEGEGEGEAETVTFASSALEEAVREALGLAPTETIPAETAARITAIELDDAGVNSLEGIQALSSLTQLRLSGNDITSAAALSSLENLQILDLSGNPLASLDGLSSIASLRELLLNGADLSMVSLEPLASLEGLTRLSMESTGIAALPPMQNMAALRILELEDNGIENISGLAGLSSLEILDLTGNAVVSIDALQGLTALQVVQLSSNQITDIGPLGENSGLGTGDLVRIGNNPLSAESACPIIAGLEDSGVNVSTTLDCGSR